MYLMYTVPYTFTPNQSPECWKKYGEKFFDRNNAISSADNAADIPQNLIEVEARYPGDAGSFSDMHISMGHWIRPALPEIMSHAHLKMEGDESDHGIHDMHGRDHESMSHEEHLQMMHENDHSGHN